MKRQLVYYPEDILRAKAEVVTDFGPDLVTLAADMREIMHTYRGMGLAALQVNDRRRVIIVEYTPDKNSRDKPIPFTIFINPKITAKSQETNTMNEGCLSIPYVEVSVKRPREVTVEAQNVTGESFNVKATGMLARILQHEIDHLDGKLILDYDKPAYPVATTKPRTIVWGSTEFTTTALNILRSSIDLVQIVTETAKPSGRNRELTPTIAKQYAETLGVPSAEPEDLRDPRVYNYLLSLKPDLMIVAAYGRLIPQALYTIPRFGTLNIHPSLLPKYRGSTPIQAAILAGDKQTGVTIMKLAPEFDTGEIVAYGEYKLEGTETYGELEYELAQLGGEMLKEILPDYLAGKLATTFQDEAKASTTKKITAPDRWLNLDDPAELNERKVRAYTPEPSAFVLLEGQPLKILEAHVETGKLIFNIVQPAGKNPMPWADFLRGWRKPLAFDSLPK